MGVKDFYLDEMRRPAPLGAIGFSPRLGLDLAMHVDHGDGQSIRDDARLVGTGIGAGRDLTARRQPNIAAKEDQSFI